MSNVTTTLNDLAELTLIACDASYFSADYPVPVGNVLAPLADPNPVLPLYSYQSQAAGFVVQSEVSDPATGGKYIIYLNQSTSQAIVAFGGTDGTNPQDWSVNTNLGWDQWKNEKASLFAALTSLVNSNSGLTINFTGQSLGGALAQYAAYDWVNQQVQAAQANDTTYDKSKITLTTFNGLGALFELEKNDSYDPSVLNGIGPSGNFYVANDLVSQIGGVVTAPNGERNGVRNSFLTV